MMSAKFDLSKNTPSSLRFIISTRFDYETLKGTEYNAGSKFIKTFILNTKSTRRAFILSLDSKYIDASMKCLCTKVTAEEYSKLNLFHGHCTFER
ncbi:hypothetical protein RRG08_009057 [Elysia crispata]|uniref:Uncharacterized protein n=1 Tax=Elysia crispata TaxID=231223 RepID=A0AAE1ACK9_9GAST|nr:hypothetical protein RRG08_009057 [Elysia crispata]